MTDSKLLSDTGGKITEILVQIQFDLANDMTRRAAYESLLLDLGRSARLIVVTSRSTEKYVEDWLQGLGRVDFVVLPVPDNEFNRWSAWARDALLVARKNADGSNLYLEPRTMRESELASALGGDVRKLPTVGLDGGSSLVIGESRWLVGAEAVRMTIAANSQGYSWDEAVQHICKQLGRKPDIVGFERPEGEGWLSFLIEKVRYEVKRRTPPNNASLGLVQRLAVRAFVLAAAFRSEVRSLLRDPLHTEWLHIDMVVSVTGCFDGEGKPIVLVADPTYQGCPPSKGATRKGKKFTALARRLEMYGYAVRRNPAPYVHPDVLPYNNTIVQTDPKVVWLPTFGPLAQSISALDDENVRIWRDLGFNDIRRIEAWSALVGDEGSIRCATLPLRRA